MILIQLDYLNNPGSNPNIFGSIKILKSFGLISKQLEEKTDFLRKGQISPKTGKLNRS